MKENLNDQELHIKSDQIQRLFTLIVDKDQFIAYY